MTEYHCLHCGSGKIEKVMDEAIACWLRCLECGKESILGPNGNNPARMETKL